jgi:hypothetical protein
MPTRRLPRYLQRVVPIRNPAWLQVIAFEESPPPIACRSIPAAFTALSVHCRILAYHLADHFDSACSAQLRTSGRKTEGYPFVNANYRETPTNNHEHG